MSDFKTVEGDIVPRDSLYASQQEGVSKMRASLLSCSNGEITPKQAIQNITALRVYHQISRIIRYLDQMDKLEEKMYQALDSTLDNMTRLDLGTVTILLNLQTRLQQNMIESHKLLQPYLDIQTYQIVQETSSEEAEENPLSKVMPSSERNRLRTNAQAVLMELEREGKADGSNNDHESNPS